MFKTNRLLKQIDKIENIFFKEIITTYAVDFYRLCELDQKEKTSTLTDKDKQEMEQLLFRLNSINYLFYIFKNETKKATIWERYKRQNDDMYKGVSRMTPKEQETLKKLLQKEKDEKKKFKEYERYRQRKNAEENVSPLFHLVCENLELKTDAEKDKLLSYLLSENFKIHFQNREQNRFENIAINEEEIQRVEEEIFDDNEGLY